MRDKIVVAIIVALLLAGWGLLQERRSPQGLLPLENKFVLILDWGWPEEDYGHTIFECIEKTEGIVCNYLAHKPGRPRP